MNMLKNKKLFLFDIDGTLAIENELFEGTIELLNYINHIGGKSIFITNNSTKSREDYVKKFSNWNIQTNIEQFVTSGYITILYLKKNFPNKKIYVLGTNSFITDLKNEGLIVTNKLESDIACVLVAFDNELNYKKLEIACELLTTKNIPFFATNPDLCCPASFGFIPDCGSICQMIENSVNKKPLYLGKPSKHIVDYCIQSNNYSKEETIIIGDRLYTDIACGLNANVDTCLVLSGEAQEKDLKHTQFTPNYIYNDVFALYKQFSNR